jgi:hypothetical protein
VHGLEEEPAVPTVASVEGEMMLADGD